MSHFSFLAQTIKKGGNRACHAASTVVTARQQGTHSVPNCPPSRLPPVAAARPAARLVRPALTPAMPPRNKCLPRGVRTFTVDSSEARRLRRPTPCTASGRCPAFHGRCHPLPRGWRIAAPGGRERACARGGAHLLRRILARPVPSPNETPQRLSLPPSTLCLSKTDMCVIGLPDYQTRGQAGGGGRRR